MEAHYNIKSETPPREPVRFGVGCEKLSRLGRSRRALEDLDLARARVEPQEEVADRGEDVVSGVARRMLSAVDAEVVAVDRQNFALEGLDLRVTVLLHAYSFTEADASIRGQGPLAVTLGKLEPPLRGRRDQLGTLVRECALQGAIEHPQGRLQTFVDALLGIVPGERDPDPSTAQALRLEADAFDQRVERCALAGEVADRHDFSGAHLDQIRLLRGCPEAADELLGGALPVDVTHEKLEPQPEYPELARDQGRIRLHDSPSFDCSSC